MIINMNTKIPSPKLRVVVFGNEPGMMYELEIPFNGETNLKEIINHSPQICKSIFHYPYKPELFE